MPRSDDDSVAIFFGIAGLLPEMADDQCQVKYVNRRFKVFADVLANLRM